MIDQAFILAAGLGARMRPLTNTLPKPLLVLGGKPILTHSIEKLAAVGVKKIVINGHYKIEKLEDYVQGIKHHYADIEFVLLKEDDLLETGGGTVNALQALNREKPFYMMSGDGYWVDKEGCNTLQHLSDAFLNSDNDMTLVLQATDSMDLTMPVGDYNIKNGQAVRSLDQTGTHMFTSIRALHPRVLDGYKLEKYSFLKNMDDAEAKGRLGAFDHEGAWYHISTPEDLEDVDKALFLKAS